MTHVNALAPAFFKLDAANILFAAASVGDRTQRDDPRVHDAQELRFEAVQIAWTVGVSETDLYRLANAR